MEDLISKLRGENVSVFLADGNIKIKFNGENLSKDLIELIKSNKEALINYLGKHASQKGYEPFPKATILPAYPLSFAQHRMWLLSQFKGVAESYSLFGAFEINLPLKQSLFEQAVQQIVTDYEILRTAYKIVDEEIRQIILSPVERNFQIGVDDFTDAEFIEDSIDNIIAQEGRYQFDLEKGDVIRVRLIKKAESQFVIILNVHHIVCDGNSMELLIDSIFQNYQLILKGTPAQRSLSHQYKDYAVWEQAQLTGKRLEVLRSYWAKEFQGGLPVLNLPVQGERPAFKSYEGKSLSFSLDKKLTQQIRNYCEVNKVMLFAYILSAVKVLLYRYSNQTDLVVGVPVSDRPHSDLDNQIGIFINTLAMRTQLEGSSSFTELVEKVKKNSMDALNHRAYPFEQLLEDLQVERDPSRSPLFDVMFSLQNQIGRVSEIENSQLRRLDFDRNVAQYDLTIELVEGQDQLHFDFNYASALFSEQFMKQMQQHFQCLLSNVAQNPDQALHQISLFDDNTIEALLQRGRGKNLSIISKATSVIDLIEEQAEIYSKKIALEYADVQWNYQDLLTISNQFSHFLSSKNIKKGSHVAIQLERSNWMITALLAVMKSGACYVPIDIKFPKDRQDYIYQDSACELIIDDKLINQFIEQHQSFPTTSPTLKCEGTEPAYVIYTSGSTGKPKGVVVSHLSLMNRLMAELDILKLNSSAATCNCTNYVFDVSLLEIFLPLIVGGKVVIPTEEQLTNPQKLLSLIIQAKVSELQGTPSFIKSLLQFVTITNGTALDATLNRICIGGESLSKNLVSELRQKLPDVIINNHYGPTEITIDAIALPDVQIFEKNIIGRPLPNTQVVVLNEHLQLQPEGVVGELCIGGNALADGYLNLPELTAEKFIEHPFDKANKLYRTGDQGRFLPGGDIEFIGRNDDQVKIRGFRIELGEVERSIDAYEEVNQVFVLAKESEDESLLVAYIIWKNEESVESLQAFLESTIPHYMIPNYFIAITEMPLTINGKIDKNALPQVMEQWQADRNIELPTTELEQRISKIWEEVLKRPSIGRNDDFFRLGGHSLKAISLLNYYHKEFGVRLELRDLFMNTTLNKHADLITSNEKNKYEKIPALPKQMHYALSDGQRRLWVLNQFEKASKAYNMLGLNKLTDDLNIGLFRQALFMLVERHEALRTVFKEDESNEPRQFIKSADTSEFEVKHEILQGAKTINSLINQELDYSFDLTKGPLFRAIIIQTQEGEYFFLYNLHHIIGDGTSLDILTNEIMHIYEALLLKQEPHLPQLSIQYRDYAAWQLSQLQDVGVNSLKNYWIDKFSDELPVLNLPTDFSRPTVKTYEGASYECVLPRLYSASINEFAQTQGGTLFMGLLAMIKGLFYHYTSQQDICIGTPVEGREHADLMNQIGFYVNTLALRTQFDAQKGFTNLFEQVKQTALDGFTHQAYPFDRLVEELKVSRDLSRSPIFDVMLVLQQQEEGLQEEGVNEVQLTNETAKFDLTFTFTETSEGLHLHINYNKDLYIWDFIERLAHHFVSFCKAALSDVHMPIASINYLSEAERQVLLPNVLQVSKYPKAKTIVDFFQTAAKENSEQVSVVFGERHLSYQELDELSNQLGHYLVEACPVEADTFIAIELERSEWLIVAILAVLKTGAAYVPIDPAYPIERKDYIKTDSKCQFNINESVLNDFQQHQSQYASVPLSKIISDEQLAYMIYTSGTTGKPKGVMIEHRNLISLLFAEENPFDFTSDDVWTLFHSYCFDFSVWEIFGSLLHGGKLVIVPAEIVKDPSLYIKLLSNEKVTVLNQTPSAFYHLTHFAKTFTDSFSLRYVIFGGESLSPAKLTFWKNNYPDLHLINMYGITETTIHVTYKEITSDEITNDISNIGKALSSLYCYILNENRQLVPQGIVGELYVGGHGLARGYWQKDMLTQQRFIPDPFNADERLYRTGDLVRLLPSGEMEYKGRVDDQVKIRGHRIELGEIEHVLDELDGVEKAVVVIHSDETNDKSLVAYWMGKGTQNQSSLKEQLAQKLPHFMVPSQIIHLKQLPLTVNGKIDKSALPKPQISSIDIKNSFEKVQTVAEQTLAGLWSEVLGLEAEAIGRNSDFFELGGHSLKATVLLSKIRQKLQIDFALKDVFSASVLHAQARLIEQATKYSLAPIVPVSVQDSYPLSSSQRRMWILSQFEEGKQAYTIPGIHVFDQPVDSKVLESAFQKLLERHESLRTVFVKGVSGEVGQVIMSVNQLDYSIPVIDFNGNAEEFLSTALATMEQCVFDLEKGPLWEVKLMRCNNEWVLAYSIHHIISDGWSLEVMLNDWMEIYTAQKFNRELSLPALRNQYKDYAVWQQNNLRQGVLQHSKRYWLNQFQGQIPQLDLPSDLTRPLTRTYGGALVKYVIGKDIIDAIRQVSNQEGTTLFMICVAAINALFYKYTNKDDIILGTPIAGRDHPDLEHQLGLYVNTLAIRTRFDGQYDFRSLLGKVKDITLEAYEHQQYPFDELVNDLILERDTSRNPLFDVMVSMQNSTQIEKILDIEEDTQQRISKFDLTFNFVEMADCLQLGIEYNTAIYTHSFVEQLANHLGVLLKEVSESPDKQLININVLQERDKKELLIDFNNSSADYPVNETVLDLIKAQATKYPDNTAVVAGSDSLSYRLLNEQSNQFADYLKKRFELKMGDRVAVMMESSIESVLVILGILKSGAAYLPIDITYPSKRIQYILDDAQCTVCVTEEILRDFWSTINNYTFNGSQLDIKPQTLAYFIYTSGSTGKPKGVMVTHQNLSNLIHWHIDRFQVTKADKTTKLAGFGFDASVWEIFSTLAAGATLHFIPDPVKLDVKVLNHYFHEHRITLSFLPTQLCEQFMLEPNQSLRYLLTGGDKLNDFQPNGNYQLVNNYGPTEATVVASSCEINSRESNMPIGKPIANSYLYILGMQQELLPKGVVGEICIGGLGVAKGYWNQNELSEEKFVKNPFREGEMLYKTGDLGRWRADGQLLFMGRKDQQVSIRGYRVEIGEVETALLSYSDVKEAAVLVEGADDQVSLSAYIIATKAIDLGALQQHLKMVLPAYMLPARYYNIAEMPVTSNGKIDREALPSSKKDFLTLERALEKPVNETEQLILEAFQEFFNEATISTGDTFFDLGGTSLMGVKLIAFINKCIGKNIISLGQLYETPTIKELANAVLQAGNLEIARKSVQVTELTKGGGGIPIFIFPGSFGVGDGYRKLAAAFSDKYLIKGISYPVISNETQTMAIDSLLKLAHLVKEQLVLHQPEGDFKFIGHSLGGWVGFEVVRMLEKEGRNVEWLAVLDIPAVNNGGNGMKVSHGTSIEEVAEQIQSVEGLESLYYTNNYYVSLFDKATLKGKISAKIIAMYGSEGESSSAMDQWKNHAKEVSFAQISGNHFSIVESQGAEEIVKLLK